MQIQNRKSFIAFIFCCLFLSYVMSLSYKWKDKWSAGVLTWDVSGYYLYLPSLFYDDLGQLHNYNYIVNTYHPSGDELAAYRAPNGNYVMKYACGVAIIYSPAFAVGHLWAKYGGYPVDGFSRPYAFCLTLEALLITFIGIWFMRKVLLRYFSDQIVALALISLCLATNYLNFVTFSNLLTHNYLFTIYAIILYLTDKWHKEPSYKISAVLGFFCGLAALTRPTEIICIIIPLLWLVTDVSSLKEKIKLIGANFSKIGILILCATLVGSVQLIYWKIYSGSFLYWSYSQDESLNFLKLNIWNCFFSIRKGWFIYTPFMLLSVLGFIPLYIYRKPLFWATFIFTLLNLWIFTAWSTWTYGGSFSQRQVVQSYAVLFFPICALFKWAFQYRVSKLLLMLFLAFCIWLNLVMTWQANAPGGFMESDNMTPKYFWTIFGHLNLDNSKRRFVEVEDEVPASKEKLLNPVYKSDTGRIEVLNTEHQFLSEANLKITNPHHGWYRASMEVYLTGWQYNGSKNPYVYIGLYSNNKIIRNQSYLIQRVMNAVKWQKILIDIETPETGAFDKLKAGLDSNHSDKDILVKNVEIEFVPGN
ncbi:MAG: hypothetical protein JWO06_2153 [Bacteroidota bacterium]|nr:hypothetical protein [Bacteroidota bacterium]